MPRSADALNASEWAVLGLLAEAPTHGFAIAKAMTPDGAVRQIWSMRRPLRLPRARRARPSAVAAADGFDRTVLQWRLHSTQAAVEFIDTLLTRPGGVV